MPCTNTALRTLFCLLLAGLLVFALCACGETYPVEYDGYFPGGKASYRAGQTVRLTIPLATDTDYSFDVDGAAFDVSYENSGAILTFTMPAHGVKVRVSSHNSMAASSPYDEDQLTLLVDFCQKTFSAEGESYNEIVLYFHQDMGCYFLHTYETDETGEGLHKVYPADYDLRQEVFALIEAEQLSRWEAAESPGTTGGEMVVKYLDGDRLIRISTDNIPTEKTAELTAVGDLLYAAVSSNTVI